MRNCTPFAFLAVSALLLVSAAVHAQTIVIVNITNAAENPPTVPTLTAANGGGPRPASFGTATFTFAADLQSIAMDVEVHNIDLTGSQTADINDNLTLAHIHASDTATATTNVGVVWGFFGTPFHNTNTTFPNDGLMTPFPSDVGGTFHLVWNNGEGAGANSLATNMARMIQLGVHPGPFHAYINFHTTQFGSGEIRGMIPEPTSGAMLLSAVFVALSARRRRAAE